jgi:hypothetical protein
MMRLSLWMAAAPLGLAACGDSFSAGSSDGGGDDLGLSDGTSPADAGTQDGALEASAPDASAIDGGGTGVPCGAEMSCPPATPVCCLASTAPSCAHVQCGCDTQLACASDLDCPGLMPLCCIGNVQDNCSAGHFVSLCKMTCLGSDSHLCDPNSKTIQCLSKSCSTNPGDLQNVGLPAGEGYGVCAN